MKKILTLIAITALSALSYAGGTFGWDNPNTDVTVKFLDNNTTVFTVNTDGIVFNFNGATSFGNFNNANDFGYYLNDQFVNISDLVKVGDSFQTVALNAGDVLAFRMDETTTQWAQGLGWSADSFQMFFNHDNDPWWKVGFDMSVGTAPANPSTPSGQPLPGFLAIFAVAGALGFGSRLVKKFRK